jgi:spore maturation protein CgeB
MHDRLDFYTAITIEGKGLPLSEAITLASKGLEAKMYEMQPDLLVVISAFFLTDFQWKLFRQRGQKVALILTESPYEDDRQIAQIERAEPTVTLINDPTNLTRYRNGNRHVYYMPHAYDPMKHRPGKVKQTRDFIFVGTGYPSRVEFFEQVDFTGLRATIAGNWRGLEPDSHLRDLLLYEKADHCSYNSETIELYQSAKVSANLYRASTNAQGEANSASLGQGWSVGPREIELAATETFFVREPRGEGDELFPMLPTFSEPAEFGELVRWWASHDRQRKRVAVAARAAIQDRTFDAHARRLLRLLP